MSSRISQCSSMFALELRGQGAANKASLPKGVRGGEAQASSILQLDWTGRRNHRCRRSEVRFFVGDDTPD